MALNVVPADTFRTAGDHARSLYIHVPFCRRRCGYCNFSLLADRNYLINRYLKALQIEVGGSESRPYVDSVFLGGGTPSQLNSRQFELLAEMLRRSFEIAPDVEFSIECNPEDLTEQLADVWRAQGINRISLGVQSLDDQKLAFLERSHRRDDICRAVALAKSVTENVSLDLMFGVPQETTEDWRRDLEAAIELEPQHLSTYELTIEKGTSFWNRQHHGRLAVPNERRRAELYESAIDTISNAGFEHYEISSFALPGSTCRHNLSYWNGREYLAYGPGAARFVDGVREVNHRSTATWLKRLEQVQSPVAEREVLSSREVGLDRLVFGLRQVAGISTVEFRRQTGRDVEDVFGTELDLLRSIGLIEFAGERCRLTSKGLLMYDSIADRIVASSQTG